MKAVVILPTGWFDADLAEIEKGDHVLVFGCGPVGRMAIASAMLTGGRVIAVDRLPDRRWPSAKGTQIIAWTKWMCPTRC